MVATQYGLKEAQKGKRNDDGNCDNLSSFDLVIKSRERHGL